MTTEEVETPEVGAISAGEAEQQQETTAELQARLVSEKAEQESKNGQQSQEEESLLEGVTKGEDGLLTVTRGESIYKGKTTKELFSNILHGIEEKDAYLKKLKAAKSIQSPVKIGGGSSNAEADKAPDYSDEDELMQLMPDENEIRREVFTQRGIDPKFYTYRDADWIGLQEEKELRDFQLTKMMNAVADASRAVDTIFSQKSAEFVNIDIINKATTNAQEILVDSGLDPEQYAGVYREVLEEVYADPKNKKSNGVLIFGRIETALAKRLNKASKTHTETSVQKQIEKQKQTVKEQRDKIKGGGTSSGKFSRTTSEPQNIRAATTALRKQLAQGII